MVQQTFTKQVFIPKASSPVPVSPLVSDSGEDENVENGTGEEHVTSTISGVQLASESSDEEGSTTSVSELGCDEEVLKKLIEKFVSKDKDAMSASNLDSSEKRGNQGNNLNNGYQKRRQQQAHSVEYWSLGRRGKPKNLIRKYSRNTPGNVQHNNGYAGAGNPVQCTTYNTYPVPQQTQPLMGYHPQQPSFVHYPAVNLNTQNVMLYSNPNPPLIPQQQYSIQYHGFPQVQAPLQVYSPAATGVTQHLNLNTNVFVSPEQCTQPTQFVPVPTAPISTYIPQPPMGVSVTPYVEYVHSPSFDTVQPQPVQYYQGAPMYYQSPQLVHVPVVAPSYQTYSAATGTSYSTQQQTQCPPQMFENSSAFPNVANVGSGEVNISATVPINEHAMDTEIQPEPDSATPASPNSIVVVQSSNEGSEVEQSNVSWNTPGYFLSQTNSPLVSSSSEVNSNGAMESSCSQTESDEGVSSTTSSGYNSMLASPNVLEHVTQGTIAPVPSELIATNCDVFSSNNLILSNNMFGGFETYFEKMGFNVKQWSSNDSAMIGSSVIPIPVYPPLEDSVMMSTSVIPVYPPSTQDIVFSGTFVILVYSKVDGNSHVITYNAQDVPYVASTLDPRIQQYMTVNSNMLCYNYYVPPRTSDDDYFGGQITMWQMKMSHYFNQFNPHSWKMHGVPELFNLEEVTKGHVDVVGEFHIVSKLRFCCRTCKTPWTSKKGTIVFKFCFNKTFQRGWILLRIFGQTCMKDDCADWLFQNPACYPEEIDRAMKKLSEYIGLKCYGLAVNVESFAECFKSIRKVKVHAGKGSGTNIPTPHKQEFCQACLNGVCKNLYIAPHQAIKNEQS